MKSRYVDCILYRLPQVPASLPGLDSRLKGSLFPRPSLHTTHSPPTFHSRPPAGGGPCLLAAPWVTRYCYLLRPLLTLTLDYWWPWRDRRALMGWLAGCGAPCWLATQVNRLIPKKYICVLHWNFVLPYCPAQASLPGAALHPPPWSSGASYWYVTCQTGNSLRGCRGDWGGVRHRLPSPPSPTHIFPCFYLHTPLGLACSCHLMKGQGGPGREATPVNGPSFPTLRRWARPGCWFLSWQFPFFFSS